MHVFKTAFLGAALALSAAFVPVHANEGDAAAPAIPSGAYKMDPTHASLIWRVNHFGLSNYTARFTDFDIKLTLDMDNLEASTVSAHIDPLSVRTDHKGKEDFDGEISKGAKFLNATAFPSIDFRSTGVERTGETTALVHGNLTMLGVTKPVTLEVKLNGAMPSHPYAKVPAAGFHASGTLRRSDFGFDHLIPYVSDDVSFVIEAEFTKAD